MTLTDIGRTDPRVLADRLRRLGPEGLNDAYQIVNRGGVRIMAEAKMLTPVRTGTMRSEIHSELHRSAHTVSMLIVSGMVYSLVQHENDKFRHTVGQAHFIAVPFDRQAPAVIDEVAAMLQSKLEGRA